ncbi:MAG: DUF2752 domain-containing protein [Bacteroidales bacterium]|nr:MAG: DUF2752 domain-containing protein [Bacteroidales bacterium]
MSLPKLWEKSYNRINLIFTGIVLSIFIYSGIFSPGKDNYPVQCIHEKMTGKPCPTCGLSHSFSAILHGDLKLANQWNINGIPLFLFFFIQLFMRLGFILLVQKSSIPLKYLIFSDIAISVILFIFCFRRLLVFWSYY